MNNGWWVRGALSVALAIAPLGAASAGGAQEPPDPPTDVELDEAILTHHPDLMDRPLGEGLQVWFVLDSDGNVAATGIDEADGLEAKVQAEYPSVTPGYAFRVDHITVNGRFVPILWLVPAFVPGGTPLASSVSTL